MKLTQTNVIKTLDNYNEIVTKIKQTIKEMGCNFWSNYENTVLLINKEDTITIRNAQTLEEFDIPVSYLLDEKGIHESEFKKKKEEQDALDRIRLRPYIK